MANEEKLRTQLSLKPVPKLRTSISYRRLAAILFSVIALAATTITVSKAPKRAEIAYFEGDISRYFDQASKSGKLCMIEFSTDYCYPCREWQREFLENPDLYQELGEEFVYIRINKESIRSHDKPFWNQYQFEVYPTVLITDAMGKELFRYTPDSSFQVFTQKIREAVYRRSAESESTGYVSPEDEGEVHLIRNDTGYLSLTIETGKAESYGLVIDTLSSYEEAAKAAHKLEKSWNKDIWIEKVRDDHFLLILGSFSSEKDAEVAHSFMKSWNGADSYITRIAGNM